MEESANRRGEWVLEQRRGRNGKKVAQLICVFEEGFRLENSKRSKRF
jgi:hypothetical protein